MIRVKVEYPKEQLAQVTRGVRNLANLSFVKSLPLKQYADWVTKRLQKESPKSGGKGSSSQWLRWIRAGGESASPYADVQKPKFWKGWVVDVAARKYGLSVDLGHELLDMGDLGEARFRAITEGHRSFSWIPKRKYWVKIRGWYLFTQTTKVDVPSDEGTPVVARVGEYLQGWFEQRFVRDIVRLAGL